MATGAARLAGAFVAVGMAAAVVLGGGWYLYTKPGPLSDASTVVIPAGSGVQAIGRELEEAGVIDQALVFALGARLEGGALKAGEYVFPAGLSVKGAVDLLQSGKTVVRRFTVPEGWTSAQVVTALAGAEGLAGDIAEVPAEGTLLPETYHFSWGDARADVLQRMQAGMRRALDELWEQRAPDLPIASKQQALVLASIVERETGVPEERPRVAAVFLNRLRKGMKLQSDPTVIYGLSEGQGSIDRPLTRSDLATAHPYNTYVIDGLPPAPIANPGAASLAAVLRPADTDDLYFVADGNGGHAFAKTLADHNRNVAKWRQVERERNTQ